MDREMKKITKEILETHSIIDEYENKINNIDLEIEHLQTVKERYNKKINIALSHVECLEDKLDDMRRGDD